MADFKDRLKASIKSSGKDLEEVARISGVSKRTIEGWMRKRDPKTPKIDQGYNVAKALGASLDALVSGEPPEGISPAAYRIARDFDRLDDIGQELTIQLVSSLRETHRRGEEGPPMVTGGASS